MIRRLINFAGGRRLRNTDLEAIQNQLDALRLVHGDIGPFVVDGCQLTDAGNGLYNLSAGIVYLNATLYTVAAQINLDLSSPGLMMRAAASVQESTRVFPLLSLSQPTLERPVVEIVASTQAANGQALYVLTAGMRSLRNALDDVAHHAGMIYMYAGDLELSQPAQADNDFNIFTGQGNGVWRGWRLCNGAAGTKAMQGRFPVGYDASSYPNVRATGGLAAVQLTASESGLPAHDVPIGNGTSGGGGSLAGFSGITPGSSFFSATGIPVGAQGASQAHENRPPYYVVYYLEYIGFGNSYKQD